MEFDFHVNMESEAIRTLNRIANPPLKHMHKALAKHGELSMKAEYLNRFKPRKPSIYQGIKAVISGGNPITGELSGATLHGITGREGTVFGGGTMGPAAIIELRGPWPKAGTNYVGHVSLSSIASAGGMDDDDVDIANIRSGGVDPNGIGAFISFTASGGLHVTWDKPLKEAFPDDIHVPAQRLEGKQYGEFGYIEDFMYLGKRQIEGIMEVVSNMVDTLLGVKKAPGFPDQGSKKTPAVVKKEAPATVAAPKPPALAPFPVEIPPEIRIKANEELTLRVEAYRQVILRGSYKLSESDMNQLIKEKTRSVMEDIARRIYEGDF